MNRSTNSARSKVNLTRPLPDEFLGLSPAELEDERARLHMLLIDSTDPRDSEYWQTKVDDLDRRITRYSDAGVRWPNRAEYDDLLAFARELKAAVDLPRFVDDVLPFTALKQTGDHWTGHCPIPGHHDRTPSFAAWQDGGWTCFGRCGRSGDVFVLVGLCRGLATFREQVQLVAAYVGKTVQ